MTTLCAIEIGDASSLALARVENLTGYRAVEVTAVETIDDERFVASVTLDSVEQVDRLIAALVEARAWIGWPVLREECGAIDLGGES